MENINPPGNEFGFHYDVDDFKFLKLFIYLSDVDKKMVLIILLKKGKKNSLNILIEEFLTKKH